MLSCFSHVRLLATPWTTVHQAPQSIGFFREAHWSGVACPPPRDLPNPGIEPALPVALAFADGLLTTEPPGKPTSFFIYLKWFSG